MAQDKFQEKKEVFLLKKSLWCPVENYSRMEWNY